MALDSTARQAEDGCLLALGFVKDRRLLTGSPDQVYLSPTDLANSDQIGLSPTTVPTSSDGIPLLMKDPPGSAEEGHGFGFVTTTATAGSELMEEGHGLAFVTPTTAPANLAEERHGLVAPMAEERQGCQCLVTPMSCSNLNQSLLASMNKTRLMTTRFAETRTTPRSAEDSMLESHVPVATSGSTDEVRLSVLLSNQGPATGSDCLLVVLGSTTQVQRSTL